MIERVEGLVGAQVLPREVKRVTALKPEEFMAAYRRAAAEWGVRLPTDPARWGLPPAGRYAVLHVRESDKLVQHGAAGYRARYEEEGKAVQDDGG